MRIQVFTLALLGLGPLSACSVPIETYHPPDKDSRELAQQAYIKAPNTDPGDHLGASVALSRDGSTLAVGADLEDGAGRAFDGDPNDNAAPDAGAVYVFTRSGSTWNPPAYLKASNTGVGDHFGGSVALSADGSTLAIGAPQEDSAAIGINGNQFDDSDQNANTGAVYVYTRSGGAWQKGAYVKASNTGAGDRFGSSVALSSDGTTLVVSAPGEDSGTIGTAGVGGDDTDELAPDAGAVYVFRRSNGVWRQEAYVKASNTGAGDLFGSGVALSADGLTLAVGAAAERSAATGVDGDQSDNSAIGAGAVYVFTRAAVTWSQEAYLKASNTGPPLPGAASLGHSFGASVALSADGDTLAVGAYGEDGADTGIDGDEDDHSAVPAAGAVYVFSRDHITWSQQAYVKASNTDVNDYFGEHVALSGDGTLLGVGAAFEDSAAIGIGGDEADDSAEKAGAVYVLELGDPTWRQRAYVKASMTGRDDRFGASVAWSGDGSTLAVGAIREDSGARTINGTQSDNSAEGAGAVYIFTR